MAKRIDSKNFDTEIKNIINSIIPGCSNVYIRVGYFFFSGFSLVAKALENKKVKVLVGLKADEKTHSLVNNLKKRQQTYLNQLLENVDENNILEKRDEQDAYYIFKKKLLDGSLEIRQLNEEDHSKEYIFEFTKKNAKIFQGPGVTLSGSSNASKSGFITNTELNYLHKEEENFLQGLEVFNDGWSDKNSIPLIDKTNIEEFELYTKKFHFEQNPRPYLLFIRVLDEFFKDREDYKIKYPKTITDNYYANYKYQKDAITKGIDIINEHNGLLLSDVVGLGKSIIASTIAHNLNLRTIVICPPHLEEQWKDYLNKFKVSARFYTTGLVKNALNDDSPGQKLIIVDEVHKFRNDETKDYLNLYQLCHGSENGIPNKVLLLSATPFNNKPKDTFSLIKLFQIPTRSTLQTINNLSEYFEELTKKYNSLKNDQDKKKREKNEIDNDFRNLGEQIRKIISPLIIRRSRIDLDNIKVYKDDLKKLKIEFPKV